MHSPSPESLRIDVSISGECSSVEIIRCVFPRKSSGESRRAHDDHRARAVRARRSLLFMRLNSVRPCEAARFPGAEPGTASPVSARVGYSTVK